MDSAKAAKSIDDRNQPKKDEVFESENATLSENSPNTKEIKPMNSKSTTKNTRKNPDIAEMILESLKSLKMRKGAPAEAIRNHIADKYNIDMKKLKPRVQRFLKTGLEKGYLEEGATGRFKVKKREAPKKETQVKRMKMNDKKPVSEKKESTRTKRK